MNEELKEALETEYQYASDARQTACPVSDNVKGNLMPLTSDRPPRQSEIPSRIRPD